MNLLLMYSVLRNKEMFMRCVTSFTCSQMGAAN